jgi:ACS family tartrate transporter-like MFS transporter
MGPAVIRKPKTGMRALTAQSPGPGQLMNTVAHANVSGSDEAVMQRVAWKILPFLMLLYFVAFVDRVNISFASLQMNADVGLSSVAYGIGASAFFVSYFLFEVPSNFALSKIGPRLWIARIMITWGLVSGAMMFVCGERSFYLLRFLLGMAEAGFFPGIVVYLSRWFTAGYRGRVTSIFIVAIPLSGLIGGPISGLILDRMNGAAGLRGWQWMFLLEAIPAIALGVVCLWRLADHPADVTWLSQDDKDRLEHLLDSERRALDSEVRYPLSAAFANPAVLLLAGTLFCIVFGTTGIAFFLPQIIKSFGYSNTAVGFLSAVPYLGGVIAMVAWARHSDTRRERVAHLFTATLFGSVGFVALGLLLPVHWAAMIGLCLAAMGVYASNALLWTLPSELMTGTKAAVAIGVINSLANLSGVIAPSLLGWSRQVSGGFAMPAWIFAGFLILGTVLAALFGRTSMFAASRRALLKAV